MTDENKAADESAADVPAAGSELADGQLDQVSGGVAALPKLAQVTQVRARPVDEDDGPLLP